MDQIAELQQHYRSLELTELSGLLREWVVGHILSEDRRFAAVLNEKGVY